MTDDKKDFPKVRNLFPPGSVPKHLAGMKIGQKYAGPSQAIKDLLDSQDFNTACKTGGWVEVKLVARFTDDGAMFHTLEMSHAILTSGASNDG